MCSVLSGLKHAHRKCFYDSELYITGHEQQRLSLAFVDELASPSPHGEVQGQESNFHHFIIGHTGLGKSRSCSQPTPSTSESSTHSCFVLVLSFHPQISRTCSPGIGLIQGDISVAILIAAHC